MNAQKQLLEQAKPFANNSAVAAILTSINMEHAAATRDLAALKAHAYVQDAALAYQDDFHISASHVDVVATAAKLSAHMTSLNTLFATLACVLASLGVETIY